MSDSEKQQKLKALGSHIKALRVKSGLTQVELANIIDKDQPSIQRLERGGVNPSYYYLLEIAEGLGITLQELIDIK